MAQSGLEVASHKGLQVAPQPDEAKYFLGSSQPNEVAPNEIASGEPDKSTITVSRVQWNKALWALAVIGIVCLAAALGAGLGVDRANKHVSIASR